MRNFVAALGQHYPCKLCRGHLQQQLRDPELGPVRVNSRQDLSVWFCELHNLVNRDIGKKQFDCSPFKIDLMYLKDCGGCEVKPKNGIPVDPKTQSGVSFGLHRLQRARCCHAWFSFASHLFVASTTHTLVRGTPRSTRTPRPGSWRRLRARQIPGRLRTY